MPAVKFNNVTKVFRHHPALLNFFGHERGGSLTALQDISLSVEKGSVVMLVGPNGSGKTTFLKLICTLLLPDHGTVEVNGCDTAGDGNHVRRQVSLAVANERSFFPRLTARENLTFFAALENIPRDHQKARIDSLLDSVELSANSETLVMKFSSGMYQRLAIARALVKNPSVLLLDEPSRSLDPGSASRFWALVRQACSSGTTAIVSTHNFEEVKALGDRVAVLDRGRLAGVRDVRECSQAELRHWYFEELGMQDQSTTEGDLADAR